MTDVTWMWLIRQCTSTLYWWQGACVFLSCLTSPFSFTSAWYLTLVNI